MASIYKHKSGKWVAAIRSKNSPTRTKSFTRHADAKKWAAEQEARQPITLTASSLYKLRDAAERFKQEIVPTYKSQRTAKWMLDYASKTLPDKPLATYQPKDFTKYRDTRLNDGVSGSTVNRELNMLSRLFDVATRDWQWMDTSNPVKGITRPKNSKHRDRRPTDEELKLLHDECMRSRNEAVWAVIRFAINTGMRQGEILQLDVSEIDFGTRIAHLSNTKNGDDRDVPLNREATEIATHYAEGRTTGLLFSNWTTGDGFRSTFQRIRKRVKIDDLRFHDFRHEAASRLFERGLNQFQVAAITGHKSLQSLQRYTHLKACDLLSLLD